MSHTICTSLLTPLIRKTPKKKTPLQENVSLTHFAVQVLLLQVPWRYPDRLSIISVLCLYVTKSTNATLRLSPASTCHHLRLDDVTANGVIQCTRLLVSGQLCCGWGGRGRRLYLLRVVHALLSTKNSRISLILALSLSCSFSPLVARQRTNLRRTWLIFVTRWSKQDSSLPPMLSRQCWMRTASPKVWPFSLLTLLSVLSCSCNRWIPLSQSHREVWIKMEGKWVIIF